jgi:alkaline phosphatase D
LGVEFAGTAVTSASPIGQNVTKSDAEMGSRWLISTNLELQWQDLYYRGYYTLEIGYDDVRAEYFGMPEILSRNGKEIKIAEFVIKEGENRVSREEKRVAYAGAIRGGEIKKGTVVDTGSS